MKRRNLFALAAAVLVLASGCSDSNEATVSGAITVDGTPPKEGSIGFIPADGQSRTAGGQIADGKYEARVPIGKMLVQVRVPKVVGQRKLYNTPDSPTQPILEEVLPAKYNSQTELELTVKPGENQQDYQLKSK